MDQKKRLLISLLVVWGVILSYRVLLSEGPQRGQLKYVKGTIQTAKKESGDAQAKLQTDLLDQEPPPLPKEVRNIFAPLPSPKPPPPPAPVRPSLPPPPPPPPPPVSPPPPGVTGAPPPETGPSR